MIPPRKLLLAVCLLLTVALSLYLILDSCLLDTRHSSTSGESATAKDDSQKIGGLPVDRKIIDTPASSSIKSEHKLRFLVLLGINYEAPPGAGVPVTIADALSGGVVAELISDSSGIAVLEVGHPVEVIATARYGATSAVAHVALTDWSRESPVMLPLNLRATLRLLVEMAHLPTDGNLYAAAEHHPIYGGRFPGVTWIAPALAAQEDREVRVWELSVPSGLPLYAGVKADDGLLLYHQEIVALLPGEIREVVIRADRSQFYVLDLCFVEQAPLDVPRVPDLGYLFTLVLLDQAGMPIITRVFPHRPPFNYKLIVPRTTKMTLEILSSAYAPQSLPLVATLADSETIEILLRPTGVLRIQGDASPSWTPVPFSSVHQITRNGTHAEVGLSMLGEQAIEIRGIGDITSGLSIGSRFLPLRIRDNEVIELHFQEDQFLTRQFILDITVPTRTSAPIQIRLLDESRTIRFSTLVASPSIRGDVRYLARGAILPGRYMLSLVSADRQIIYRDSEITIDEGQSELVVKSMVLSR